MPLDLSLAPTSALHSPDDIAPGMAIDEQLLHDLPDKLGVRAPTWQKLAESAYDDPELTDREVEALAAEVRTLREHWLASQRDAVIAERNITARDHEQRLALADAALLHREDPTRDTLDRLLALCESAIASGLGIVGLSD
jgi:hypothetical protein